MMAMTYACDICGKEIGTKGGYVDLHAHDAVTTVVPVWPPRKVGVYDLCAKCRDELSDWLEERKAVKK